MIVLIIMGPFHKKPSTCCNVSLKLNCYVGRIKCKLCIIFILYDQTEYTRCALVQIIRILEKLSPKQAHLFSSVSLSNSRLPAGTSNKCDSQQNNFIQAAESTEDNSTDVVTTAFPFLLQ